MPLLTKRQKRNLNTALDITMIICLFIIGAVWIIAVLRNTSFTPPPVQ